VPKHSYLLVSDYACKNQTLMGVYDGHGTNVTGFVKKVLPSHLESNLPPQLLNTSLPLEQEETLLRQAFVSAYLDLNSDLRKRQGIDSEFPGTTAVTVLLRGSFAFGANAGDSRVFWGKRQMASGPQCLYHTTTSLTTPASVPALRKPEVGLSPSEVVPTQMKRMKPRSLRECGSRPGHVSLNRRLRSCATGNRGRAKLLAVPLTKDHKFLELARWR